ncbi:hypothetical protein HBH52_249980 [Parastagonospora nodorum]|nr:hypothetical protein HBH52_249980 [Parastagonospora nodorum]
MSQTNVREEYRITTLEVIKLIEDLISYYSAKVKIEDLSNTLTLILSETAQQQSLSIVSNRSTALITNKFSVASLTKLAILNNANVALVDAMHYSIQKLEENYFKVIDALTMTLIKDNDDLLGTINSYIKPPLKRCKTEAADSRHAKVSKRRTKKDKDLENSNTSSDVLRLRRRNRAAACAQLAKRKQLGKKAQLKKTRDEEELAKAKKEKEEKEAQERKTYLDINSKDNLEDEEATTAKDLAREQKKRLKALLNAKTRDSLSARVETAIEHCTLEDILGEVQNAQAEGNATEHNAVNNDDKLYSTKGERTFYCACKRSFSFNAEPQQAATIMTKNIGRLTKEEVIEMQIDTTNAIFKALTAANKLVALQSYIILEANTPAMHPKATKHCLALLAAQFIIVCSFRKVDKHVFRAYNTISVTAYCLCLDFLSTVQNAKQQYRDILEKEGLNKSEASRRVIFNRFKMQAIASYPALATLKAAQFKTYSSCKVKRFTLNSVKDLFTNLSKDYFLVQEARAITKSSLKFQNLSNLCSKVKILGTLSRT